MSLKLTPRGDWFMNKFDAMSDSELKRYFVTNRDDESFHAYMDRRYARPNRHTISPNDPEWESKMIASVKRQLGNIKPDSDQSGV